MAHTGQHSGMDTIDREAMAQAGAIRALKGMTPSRVVGRDTQNARRLHARGEAIVEKRVA